MFVYGEGPTPCAVMMVGEAFGYHEQLHQRPFYIDESGSTWRSGKSALELTRMLERAHLPRANCYLTNLANFQPPQRNGKQLPPTREDIEHEMPRLARELAMVRPRWIGAIGRHAARVLTGQQIDLEYAHAQAYPLAERIRALVESAAPEGEDDIGQWLDKCVVVPLYHPAAGLHNPSIARFVWFDIQQFAKYVHGTLTPSNPVDAYPNPQYVSSYWFNLDAPVYGLDTEGSVSEPWSVQISSEPGKACVIEAGKRKWLAQLDAELREGDGKLVGHNWLHDWRVCRALGIDMDSISFDRIEDTMLMSFCLGTLPLGLKPLSRRVSGAVQQSYSEVIAPAERKLALSYITKAIDAKVCKSCNGTGKVPAYGKDNVKGLVVHRNRSAYDVYIGRPSKWGNPFRIGPDGHRAAVIEKYRRLLLSNRELVEQARTELKGKVLGCWCAPLKCHGDVLAQVANGAVLKRQDKCPNPECVDGGLWPAREGQLSYNWAEGGWKLTYGWQIQRYLRSLKADIEAGTFNDVSSDSDDDAEEENDAEGERKPRTIRQRWASWDDDVRRPVEELLGEMPAPTLSDVERSAAIAYAARDADLTARNFPVLDKMIDEAGLRAAYRLDLSITPACAEMEQNGMAVDVSALQKLSRRLRRENDVILRKIQHIAKRPINPASGDQVAGLLFGERRLSYSDDDERELQPELALSFGLESQKKTKSGSRASTDDKVLEGLKLKYAERPEVVEVVQLILDYRVRHKIDTTYAEKIPRIAIRQADGHWRVHTHIRQTVAATYRLASSDPINLQNIPVRSKGGADLGRLVRECFVAPSGFVLASSDYSQVELRVLAALSGDDSLLRAFREGLDPHILGASRAWRMSYDEMYASYKAGDRKIADIRESAKNLNFGIVFGITARGLQAQMELRGLRYTLDECNDLIQMWTKRAFPGIGAYIEEVQSYGKLHGYAKSFMGHMRHCPGVWSDIPQIREEALRQLVNFTIQSSAAEILKAGLADLWNRGKRVLDHVGSRLLMSVHDENLLEVRADERSREVTAAVVEGYMENPIRLPNGVEITTKVKFAPNWGALKAA